MILDTLITIKIGEIFIRIIGVVKIGMERNGIIVFGIGKFNLHCKKLPCNVDRKKKCFRKKNL